MRAARTVVVLRRALAASLIVLVMAGPAGAGMIVVKLGLVGGKLAVASAPAQVAKDATAAIPVRVADGRGTGKGWTLRFQNSAGLSVVGISARCASSSTCTLPTAAGAPGGSTVLQAAKATGMGIVDLVVTVRATSAATVAFAVS